MMPHKAWHHTKSRSTFFLVYTHGASTDALINDRPSIAPRPDLAILRHLPSNDVVQAKLSWLFR